MEVIGVITLVGTVGSSERKTVKDNTLVEFTLQGLPTRISAWRTLADAVPAPGKNVVVTAKLSVRSYEYEGKQRTSVDYVASTITPLDGAPAGSADVSF